jgi:alginate O-acetyltransferase complex protein AlgI
MSFNSIEYILFLLVIVLLYWRIRQVRLQNILLLLASYFFYAQWDWRFLSLILFSTITDYSIGLLFSRTENNRRRDLLMAVSVIVNLGILVFFKYYNFFVESAVDILTVLGIQANISSLHIILPVGISFYTFQTLSYTIDVYRRKLKPVPNLIDFALFVNFFPQLVAGPIERATNLLPQIQAPRTISPMKFEEGLILILLGLFKKIVLADVAAILIHPDAFTKPDTVAPAIVLQSVYLFAIQIYADFAAYSDIARGSAKLLGFELMVNFRQPYFAQSISEFWRRWHISLSTWLRDYLYIPLNNAIALYIKNDLLTYTISVMVTMLLSGLWHGANYTFILWGGLLGMFQVIYRALKGRGTFLSEHRLLIVRATTVILRVLLTFHLVLLAWVLFRSQSIRFVPAIYRSMFEAVVNGFGADELSIVLPVLVLYGASFFIDVCQIKTSEQAFTYPLPRLFRITLYTVSLLFIVYFTVKPYVPFIYFQF